MASANLGQLVGADLVVQSVAERALLHAATDCGLVKEDGTRAVLATIASGMKKGIAQPREVRR
jgi:putative DNA primase/helicase